MFTRPPGMRPVDRPRIARERLGVNAGGSMPKRPPVCLVSRIAPFTRPRVVSEPGAPGNGYAGVCAPSGEPLQVNTRRERHG